ncbi:MAG: hypothetical protein RMX96_05435 [Nostoc sp. ChiSLP02]|nr:hypothetical protein [Nostoc sp. DedSLP05]MDZ8103717.1 hypothetical protein [Nostoc sp. DedSLP01]MDZ8184292.1 hypothetical protein [Nostoc sp. ChiSLP02]
MARLSRWIAFQLGLVIVNTPQYYRFTESNKNNLTIAEENSEKMFKILLSFNRIPQANRISVIKAIATSPKSYSKRRYLSIGYSQSFLIVIPEVGTSSKDSFCI